MDEINEMLNEYRPFQKRTTIICHCCGEDIPSENIICFANGDSVCGDCLHEYARDVAMHSPEEYMDEYISENLTDRAEYHWAMVTEDKERFERIKIMIYEMDKGR